MTARRRFARFSFLGSAAAILIACGSAHLSTASAPPAAASAEKTTLATDFLAEISSSRAHDGSIVLVTLKGPSSAATAPVQGSFEGIELPFFRNGDVWQAVLGVPYDHKPGAAEIQVTVGGGASARKLQIPFTVVRADYASETLKVDPSKVRPQDPKVLERVKREVAEVGAAYATVTPRKYWQGPFALPVGNEPSSRFGTRRVYNGVQKSAHLGHDFRSPMGTPIHAAAAGKVVLAKDLFFTGNTVILDHGYGVLTVYAHMSRLDVAKGQEVPSGAQLGLSGKTGRVTGPHLHWMAVVHKQKVNPLDLTQVMK